MNVILQIQINKENSTATKTSVYLNKDSNPARHVTVIPINNMAGGGGGAEGGGAPNKSNILERQEIQEESYYDAIFEFDTPSAPGGGGGARGTPNRPASSKPESQKIEVRSRPWLTERLC